MSISACITIEFQAAADRVRVFQILFGEGWYDSRGVAQFELFDSNGDPDFHDGESGQTCASPEVLEMIRRGDIAGLQLSWRNSDRPVAFRFRDDEHLWIYLSPCWPGIDEHGRWPDFSWYLSRIIPALLHAGLKSVYSHVRSRVLSRAVRTGSRPALVCS